MTILLSVKNKSDRQILSAYACSRAKISFYEMWKFQNGTTTLKNIFFQNYFCIVKTVQKYIVKPIFMEKYSWILELS